jgi:D-lactate dehydrogenase
MKIALFSSKTYDSVYFRIATEEYCFQITHFEARLRARTARLVTGFDAVCVFVTELLDKNPHS